MRVVFTEAAINDLREISTYLTEHYPSVARSVERRLRLIMARLGRWPKSAKTVMGRPGVRVVSLVRYPYKVFYTITDDAVLTQLSLLAEKSE
jgi:toxin ParE1/3/4